MDDAAFGRWQAFDARVTRGHQVASGRNGDPRFPGGTIAMQTPFFRALGLDLSPFFPGTLNVRIAPLRYHVVAPRVTFRQVKWHPTEPAEDFSFFDVRLKPLDEPPVYGLIYFPHPETKPAHFQDGDVLELLLPYVDGLTVDTRVRLAAPESQIRI